MKVLSALVILISAWVCSAVAIANANANAQDEDPWTKPKVPFTGDRYRTPENPETGRIQWNAGPGYSPSKKCLFACMVTENCLPGSGDCICKECCRINRNNCLKCASAEDCRGA
ncbi:hypothetical protein V8F20_006572 [Naviculisporaceae sp. PSN 640]